MLFKKTLRTTGYPAIHLDLRSTMALTLQSTKHASPTTAARPRILTTHPKKGLAAWRSRTELLPGWEDHSRRLWGKPELASVLTDLRWAWKLFTFSRQYDAVVTGSERPALFFALLQRFLRRKKVPHVFLECLWNLPEGGFGRWRRRLLLRNVALGAARVIVHASRQVPAYEAAFDVPPGIFEFLRCHATLYDVAYPASEGDYIFVAGFYSRDWPTLLVAAKDVPAHFVVSALSLDPFKGLSIPANVEIRKFTPDEFNRAMAGSSMVVVPLLKGLLHSGGHQGFENAMTMGKTVVVADAWAEDYIQNGANGMVVPPADPEALRRAILYLLENPDVARRMAEKAREASREFTPEVFAAGVLRLVEECVRQKPA
jgi:glycosyltransferase involved in cell wall biosynthesis